MFGFIFFGLNDYIWFLVFIYIFLLFLNVLVSWVLNSLMVVIIVCCIFFIFFLFLYWDFEICFMVFIRFWFFFRSLVTFFGRGTVLILRVYFSLMVDIFINFGFIIFSFSEFFLVIWRCFEMVSFIMLILGGGTMVFLNGIMGEDILMFILVYLSIKKLILNKFFCFFNGYIICIFLKMFFFLIGCEEYFR